MQRFARVIALWVIALCLGWVAPAKAADGIDWSSMADTIIRTIARPRDMQVPVIPIAFAEDSQGFLWAAGEAGVLRWDGYGFRSYTPGERPDDGLRNHYIWALHSDALGRLWVGSNAGGLARYDTAADRFVPVVLADQRGEALCVWSLDDDGAGGLWVGTNRGVAHLDVQSRIMPPVAVAGHESSSVFAVPDRKVEALARARRGMLWIGGTEGLSRISPDGKIVPVALPTQDGTLPEVSRLMEDSAGRIWAGTRHNGGYLIDPLTLRATAVPVPAALVPKIGAIEIMAMEEVAPGRIWLGTFGQGILDVDAATLSVRSIVRNPQVADTLDSDLVYGLHKDRSGVTWISTTAALDQFVPPVGDINILFGDPTRPGGLPTDVTAILSRPDGSIWLGSQTNGILVLGADGKPVRTIPVGRVFCLAADAGGAVYIGSRSGLFVASASGDRVRKVEVAPRRPSAGVISLVVADGVVWIAGIEDDGLWKLREAADGSLSVAGHFTAPLLPSSSISALKLTQDGLLAVGTANGLALLNRGTGQVDSIVADPANRHGLSGNQIGSLLTDRHGRLWVGSDDDGISVLLRRDAAGRPVFAHITTADGLPNADMNSMIADKTGKVWVSTDNGLAVIDPDTFAVRALKDADGVAISTYWSASGERTRQGDILFGGMGGLTVVKPETLRDWHYSPPLAISEIHVGGKLVGSRSEILVIPPGANSLAVEFAALDFSAPNRNLYRYKLEGFDPDFIGTDAQHRVATYTNLPPGDYMLRLQGSNRNGVWAEPVTLNIRVMPAWFQTIFVRLAAGAALVLGSSYVVQARTAWLRRRQLYLENLVQERTADLISSQQKLTEMAYFDPLTALPNRRSFNEALAELLQAAGKVAQEFVLMLIDLDGFKRVNDTLGHDAGDEVLIIAAGRLRAALREGDMVARLGGDEFAIVLKRSNDHDVVKLVCDRVVNGMMAPTEIKGQPVKIGASVGVALSPGHGRTAEDLYKHADEALYQAKRSGKGVWCMYGEAPIMAGQVQREEDVLF